MSKKKKNKSQNNSQIQKKKQKKQAQAQKAANITAQAETSLPEIVDNCIENIDLPEEIITADNPDTEENPVQEAEQICENEEAESDDSAAENEENTPDGTTPDSENEEHTDNLPKVDYIAVLKERMDDIWNFISETRKISVPLIILVYTAIVVSITIPIEHARILKHLQRDASEFEEITSTESSITTLEKDLETELASGSTVVYTGFEFTDTVKGKNSDEFGSTYENDSETNTYLDIVLEYTHNSEEPLAADKVAAMTAKTGNSQYASFAAVETDDGKNIEFANNIEISSGETVRIHYIFNVPKDIKNNDKNLTVDVAVDKNTYNINIK